MGVEVDLQEVEENELLYTRLITISPRYIIVNETGQTLIIKTVKDIEDNSKNIVIPANKRQQLYWNEDTKERRFKLNIIDPNNRGNNPLRKSSMSLMDKINYSNISWNWSGDLDISNIGVCNFLLRNKNNPQRG